MRLIVISSEKFPDNEEKAFELLFSEGLETLHLRKPGAEKAQIEKILQQIDAKYHPRIVLHEHFLLAAKYNLKGIHLNRRTIGNELHELTRIKYLSFDFFADYRQKTIRVNSCNSWQNNFRGSPLNRSRSCHTFAEIEQYKDDSDYLFLSPIFDSISKSGYTAKFSEKELSEASAKGIIDSKVIALGGITLSGIERLKPYGFGGVAILGAIWNDFEKNNDLNQLAETFRCYNSSPIPTHDTTICNRPN